MTELDKAIKGLRLGKAPDTKGLRAEVPKEGTEEFKKALLHLYNTIVLCNAPPPASWKSTVVTVIPKNGDFTFPENYRSICTILLHYKLFSRLLYNRLQPTLDSRQTADQAGFRPGHSTIDHLFTFHLLRERAHEWNQNLWVAALDF